MNEQHPDNVAVDAFAKAMKAKLKKKRAEGKHGWETARPEHLARLLVAHVAKGDPVDIANFCMMLHQAHRTTARRAIKAECMERAQNIRFAMTQELEKQLRDNLGVGIA